MVRAWYMDNLQTPQQLEHHREPPEFISLEVLFERTGVEFFKLNLDTHETDGVLEKIKKTRGYKYEDQITCSKESLPNCEEILKTFFREHLHPEEEIRFILEGSGYFDVRDMQDKWIRVEAIPGDMIVVPSGLYHRFTLDVNNYIKAKRFFVSGPDWVAFFRPADDMECRKLYLKRLKDGFARKIM